MACIRSPCAQKCIVAYLVAFCSRHRENVLIMVLKAELRSGTGTVRLAAPHQWSCTEKPPPSELHIVVNDRVQSSMGQGVVPLSAQLWLCDIASPTLEADVLVPTMCVQHRQGM